MSPSVQTTTSGKATEFFRAVTGTLLAAEHASGVGRHLALSIVGTDEAPYGIYAAKVEQERLIEAGDVPWTILRVTQFHEFAGPIFTRMKMGPISVVPKMQSQPIAGREVATRLNELAEAEPAGRVNDFAGPRAERMVDLSRRWAAATGARGRVLEVPIPGGMGRRSVSVLGSHRPGGLAAGTD